MSNPFAPPPPRDPDLHAALAGIRADVLDEYRRPHAFPRILGFSGTAATLTLHVNVQVREGEKAGEEAQGYRIFSGVAEIGAAWQTAWNEGRDYLAVKLGDPSPRARIVANLFAMEGGTFERIRSRPNGNGSRE